MQTGGDHSQFIQVSKYKKNQEISAKIAIATLINQQSVEPT